MNIREYLINLTETLDIEHQFIIKRAVHELDIKDKKIKELKKDIEDQAEYIRFLTDGGNSA